MSARQERTGNRQADPEMQQKKRQSTNAILQMCTFSRVSFIFSSLPRLLFVQLLARKAINTICESRGTGLAFPAVTVSVQFSPQGLNEEWPDLLVPSGAQEGRTVDCLFAPLVGLGGTS